jgi:hypothetical protein
LNNKFLSEKALQYDFTEKALKIESFDCEDIEFFESEKPQFIRTDEYGVVDKRIHIAELDTIDNYLKNFGIRIEQLDGWVLLSKERNCINIIAPDSAGTGRVTAFKRWNTGEDMEAGSSTFNWREYMNLESSSKIAEITVDTSVSCNENLYQVFSKV